MPWLLLMSKHFIKWGVGIAVVLAVFWFVYQMGAASVQADWDLSIALAEQSTLREEQRLKELQTAASTEYLRLASELTSSTTKIIEKVPVYVTKEDDAHCSVSHGFVRLHDEAAGTEQLPKTSSSAGTAGSSQPIELSDVGRTVVGNYSTCRETALRLEQLQNWVKKIGAQGP